MAARFLLLAIAVALSVAQVWAQTAEELFEQGRQYHVGEGVEQDLTKAQAYYKRALKRDGELYAALYNSALAYHAQEDFARAHTLFIKAAKAAKNLEQDSARYAAMARNGLGSSYQKLGKEQQAAKQFAIAKRMAPSFVEAHYNHINLLIQQERFSEAEKALQVAEKRAPSDRYEKLRGRLKVEQKRIDSSGYGGVAGMVAFVVLLLLYSLYLRRKAQRNR